MGRRRQERALEDLIARTLAAGVERGREQTFLSLLTRIARRLLGLDVREAARMAQESPQTALSGLLRLAREVWVPRWVEGMGPVLEGVMDAAELPTNRGPIRLGFDLANPLNKEFFEGYTLRLAEQVTDTTREKLEAAIREGIEEGLSVPDVARKVSEVGEEFSGYRADLIARDQLHRAAISASEMQAKRSGVVSTKTWRGTLDARERPEHVALEGVTVGIDEDWDGRHPATEIACRCFVEYGIDLEAVRGGAA